MEYALDLFAVDGHVRAGHGVPAAGIQRAEPGMGEAGFGFQIGRGCHSREDGITNVGEDGRLTAWLSTQTPHQDRMVLAMVLAAMAPVASRCGFGTSARIGLSRAALARRRSP